MNNNIDNTQKNETGKQTQRVISYGYGVQNIYTEQQWQDRELHYTEALVNLVIPTQQDLNVIATFNANLDRIQTEALMEIALIERQYEKFNNLIKNAEKEIYIILKRNELQKDSKVKLTVADIDGLVVNHIKNNKVDGYLNLYLIREKIFNRLSFMKRVVEILKDKQQALITVNLLFKVENDNIKINNPKVGV